ncbi:hypothetical protein KTF21_11925 [Burkholderia multivorans]|uniref:hypothetical protein n=1 Tax=Burkholderia multivorans TaxID=87883 RepID=UPI001C22365B|nr:hypothetical protein [Burkholderia multivorans]MBU9649389.1 hypothetical protein [Burkholderia multivorans]
MNEIKHTPGPWVAVPQFVRLTSGAHQPIFKDGLWGVLPEADVERLPIATVDCADDHHAPTRTQAEFDALLIAAAPDMADILEIIAADADAGTIMLTSGVRLAIDAALIKAGRKKAPEPVRHFTINGGGR